MNYMAAYARNQATSVAAGQETNLLKNNYSTTFKGTQDYGAKVLEFTNANINAAVEQTTKLSRVRSPMEFIALSNEYARKQFEILSLQAQELAAIVRKMTAATTESVTAGVHMAV
jgi:hypothetical protein